MKRPVARYIILVGLAFVLFAAGCQSDGGDGVMKITNTPKAAAPKTPQVNATYTQPATAVVDPVLNTLSTPTVTPPNNLSGTPTPNLPATPSTSPFTVPTTFPANATTTTPTVGVILPDKVNGLAVRTLGTSEISLTWHPSEAAELKCYSVFRSMSANDGYEWIASPAETYYRDTGLSQAVTYYYYVVAESNDNVSSEKSSVVSATTTAPVVLELFGREG